MYVVVLFYWYVFLSKFLLLPYSWYSNRCLPGILTNLYNPWLSFIVRVVWRQWWISLRKQTILKPIWSAQNICNSEHPCCLIDTSFVTAQMRYITSVRLLERPILLKKTAISLADDQWCLPTFRRHIGKQLLKQPVFEIANFGNF